MRRTLQLLAAAALALPALAVSASALPNVAKPAAAQSNEQGQKVGVDETVSIPVGGVRPGSAQNGDSPGSAQSGRITRAGAWFVKVHVTGLDLAGGDVLTVASPDGSEVHSYSADPARAGSGDAPGTSDATGFWALSITGDTAVVSVAANDGAPAAPASHATVDKITRGLTPDEFAKAEQDAPRSICGKNDYQDVVCFTSSYPKEFSNTPAVARLLMPGGSMCTGWRVGANNRMLTNNHCFTSTSQAKGTEAWFNYQCPTCGGTGSGPVTKVLGAEVLKTDHNLDYTLFSTADLDKVRSFGFLELDTRMPTVGEEIYIIQHPGGKTKKLAVKDDQASSGNCGVSAVKVTGNVSGSDIAYSCDTEPGSSGSPVLSRQTHKVVGLHHFGGCPNQAVRVDLVAAEIGSLL